MDRLRQNGIKETISKNSYQIEIGGESSAELERQLTQHGILVGDWARDMMRSPDFSTLGSRTEIQVARLTPADLGFTRYPTTEQFFRQAQSFGLELLPAEAGPHARLQDTKQRWGWYYIAMDPITDRRGDPSVFTLERDGGGVWLSSSWVDPGYRWFLDRGFVFGLRK